MQIPDYDFEIEEIVKQIKKLKAKKICIQLPDGLKPKATEIADSIKKKAEVEIYIWVGSNFGACDIPQQLEKLRFDLVVNFGHSAV